MYGLAGRNRRNPCHREAGACGSAGWLPPPPPPAPPWSWLRSPPCPFESGGFDPPPVGGAGSLEDGALELRIDVGLRPMPASTDSKRLVAKNTAARIAVVRVRT